MQKLLFLIALIIISFSSVSALTWTADSRLTNDPKVSEAHDIALDESGNIHVVWRNSISKRGETITFFGPVNLEPGEIYYLQIDETGTVIVGPIRVTSNANSGGYYWPSIAIDGENDIHIIWDDWVDGTDYVFSEVFYAKLDDRGNILVGPSVVLSNTSIASSLIIEQNGNLHLGWMSYFIETRFFSDVYYSELDDNGIKTELDIRITFGSESFDPAVIADHENNIHFLYKKWNDLNKVLWYTKLDNGSNIVVNDVKLLDLNDTTQEPYSMAIDPENNLHIVFESWNQLSPPNIHYTQLDNNGNILIDRTKISFFTEQAIYPKIAIDHGGNAHVVWEDKRDGNSEIYYSNIDKNGLLNKTNIRLTNDPGISTTPNIAVDEGGNIHVVWTDNRDGNFELYYKKGVTTDTSVFIPETILEGQANVTAEIEPQPLEKSWDSAINIVLYIVGLALILLVIRFYKKRQVRKGGKIDE